MGLGAERDPESGAPLSPMLGKKAKIATLIAAAIYLAITTLSNLVLIWLERRYSIGVRKAEL